ncbi:MAG: helix-turn-helix domain-containing protein [Ktedonobacterales bacterium]|nr:helix-turn-helix domain-containing protein [Ktedonobacterales bacterium]
MAKLHIALQEKMLLSIEEAAAVLGIGRDLVYKLISELDPSTGQARLYSVKVGRRRMVSRRALEKFVEGVAV